MHSAIHKSVHHVKYHQCYFEDIVYHYALERHAAAVRQLSNGVDLYIRIATVGTTIQTVNSPIWIYEYFW